MSSDSERKAGRPPNEAMREQRREEILAAAVRLFAERGYAEADTQVLADMLASARGRCIAIFPRSASFSWQPSMEPCAS